MHDSAVRRAALATCIHHSQSTSCVGKKKNNNNKANLRTDDRTAERVLIYMCSLHSLYKYGLVANQGL